MRQQVDEFALLLTGQRVPTGLERVMTFDFLIVRRPFILTRKPRVSQSRLFYHSLRSFAKLSVSALKP